MGSNLKGELTVNDDLEGGVDLGLLIQLGRVTDSVRPVARDALELVASRQQSNNTNNPRRALGHDSKLGGDHAVDLRAGDVRRERALLALEGTGEDLDTDWVSAVRRDSSSSLNDPSSLFSWFEYLNLCGLGPRGTNPAHMVYTVVTLPASSPKYSRSEVAVCGLNGSSVEPLKSCCSWLTTVNLVGTGG